MSDAWEEIQAVKTKRNELRERLQKRRKEREDLLGGAADQNSSSKPECTARSTGMLRFRFQVTDIHFNLYPFLLCM